jgi:hypothetical protein
MEIKKLNLQKVSFPSFCEMIIQLLFHHEDEVQDQILLFIVLHFLHKNNYLYKNKELYYLSDDFLLLKVKPELLDSRLLFELRNKIREWVEKASVEDFFILYKSLEKNHKEFVNLISSIVLDKYNSTERVKYSPGLFKLEEYEGKFILRGRISGKIIKTIME